MQKLEEALEMIAAALLKEPQDDINIYEPEDYNAGKVDIYMYYRKYYKVNTKGYFNTRYIRQKRFKKHNRALAVSAV